MGSEPIIKQPPPPEPKVRDEPKKENTYLSPKDAIFNALKDVKGKVGAAAATATTNDDTVKEEPKPDDTKEEEVQEE